MGAENDGEERLLARIIYGCRSETAETEGRRGFSQVRTTQAYSLRYVEETEREKPMAHCILKSNGQPRERIGCRSRYS